MTKTAAPFTMLYLLIGYMWLFIHRPFEVWPWLGDLRIERIYMIVTITYWALFAVKTWTPNRINWGIGLFALSMILSTAFSPYTDFSSTHVQDWFKVAVFYVLVMSSIQKERDLRILIVAFVLIMGLYELHSFVEYLNGHHEYRMGTKRMVGVDTTLGGPNFFGVIINYGIPMLLPVVLMVKKRWQYLVLFALFLLACICIALTSSRTAFVMLCFQLGVLGLLSRHRWKLIFALIILLPIAWHVLPEDRQNRYLTLIDPSRGPANAQDSARGRLSGFLNGIKLWKTSPLFGVGPACHGIAIGHGFRSHNLYGQVLGDYGTLGAIALLCIIVGYFANFFEARRLYWQLWPDPEILFLYRICGVVAFTCILLLICGWGLHNLLLYTWLWYAAFQSLALRFLRDRVAVSQLELNHENIVSDFDHESSY